MKDYLVYQLMHEFGVDAPLCSYAYMTVNGEDWGLYLAVEGVEESFLARNYGKDYGELYKPDSMKMGGGRGNGRGFDFENFNPDRLENLPDMQNPHDMSDRPGMSGAVMYPLFILMTSLKVIPIYSTMPRPTHPMLTKHG